VGNESSKRTRFPRRGRKVLREIEREREGPITECRVRRGFVYIYRNGVEWESWWAVRSVN
jgi:hypothetical protein